MNLGRDQGGKSPFKVFYLYVTPAINSIKISFNDI